MYMKRREIYRCKQLLMRGADINYISSKKGITPLHYAIENKLDDRMINFLIHSGANPHIEDHNGKDCCDKVQKLKLYKNIAVFWNDECYENPQLRKNG